LLCFALIVIIIIDSPYFIFKRPKDDAVVVDCFCKYSNRSRNKTMMMKKKAERNFEPYASLHQFSRCAHLTGIKA